MSLKWKGATASANEFVPEEDVIITKEDGRQIVAARAGTPITKATAIKFGLIKEEKAEAEKSNKSAGATENKSKAGEK